MSFIKKSNATLFLFVNAFLWGTSYVWSKMLLDYLPRFSILFLSSLGGLVCTMALFHKAIRRITLKEIYNGIFLSIFSILSNTCFMFALQYTSSSNTAFIVQTSVVIVPLIMALLERRMPQSKIVLSSIIAVLGIFMLTCDLKNFQLNVGDILAFGNAIFFSIFLAGLNISSKRNNPVNFTFVHLTTNTVAFLILASIFEIPKINTAGIKSPVFMILLAASILVTVITILIQSTALKFVRAEKATLIYTLEPVTAMLVGYIFIGERVEGLRPIIGCLMILFSVMYYIRGRKPEARGRIKDLRTGRGETPEQGKGTLEAG